MVTIPIRITMTKVARATIQRVSMACFPPFRCGSLSCTVR
jgi:hypothetical protein